jgi:hypothetical protein
VILLDSELVERPAWFRAAKLRYQDSLGRSQAKPGTALGNVTSATRTEGARSMFELPFGARHPTTRNTDARRTI